MTNRARIGDWMQTFTGRIFYPLDPMPSDVHIDDIAHALALSCRFNGHCKEFYSIAQHSVLVSLECDNADALWGLLHDAAEAYVGDMIRPLKRMPAMREFRGAERVVEMAICEAFDLSYDMPESVVRADNVLLATERRDIMSMSTVAWDLPVAPRPQMVEPWTPRRAELEFRDRFRQLTLKDKE